jgi:secreted Zn-dependent insulinase-like peptidase
MQEYQNDPRLILAGLFITEKFDSVCIQDLMNHLTCDRITLFWKLNCEFYLVEETFKKAQSQGVDDWKQSIVKFERPSEIYFVPPSSFSLDDPNSSVELFFPIGTLDNIKLRTLTTIFAEILHEPFLNTLRTTEQLGYNVNLGLRIQGILTGILVSIQSEKDPLYLDSRIEAFLSESVPEILKKMTENDFKLHRSSLKLDLTQKKKTLAGESRQYWNAILSGSNDFLRHWIDSKVLDSQRILWKLFETNWKIKNKSFCSHLVKISY